MSKLVITRWNGRLLTAMFENGEAVELSVEEDRSILGNIYIGKVKNIVKNLNSAFVEYSAGCSGYYSMNDNPKTLYADGSSGRLRIGDEILVQVEKEATRTKDPVLSSNLNFAGQYAVLTAGKKHIGFSGKISDKAWKESVRPMLETIADGSVGVIVRTNAYQAQERLYRELEELKRQYHAVLEKAKYRTCFSCLYEAEPNYLKCLRSCPEGSVEQIITDDDSVFETVQNHLAVYHPEHVKILRRYTDPMVRLSTLYSLETIMEQACQKRVWLRSGGYLVIEPTEAMVVIDVNSGKYSGSKNLKDTIRLTNLEAAQEICRQLRLRNLSGIILVDFIDMKSDEDKELLMSTLRRCAAKDPIKVNVIEMTQLNLVEMTRKKGKKPLWEQLLGISAIQRT